MSLFLRKSNKTTKEDKSNPLNINKIEFVVIRLIRVLLLLEVDSIEIKSRSLFVMWRIMTTFAHRKQEYKIN